MSDNADFKECPLCGFSWETRGGFLSDPNIEIVGYQACFERLKTGYLLFNHSCEGTLAVMVIDFGDLYDGQVFHVRKTGTDECSGYCLKRDELRACSALCECAFVREIIQIIRNWPKNPAEHLSPA